MNEFVRIDAALDAAVNKLVATSESPRLDAELLLARALDVQRSYLYAHPEDAMDPAANERFQAAIARRADGVPLAYITGEKEFWSMTLHVNARTLVPRPETETLVDQALTHIPRRSKQKILDLGTGSGAIAIALAKERPLCTIVATDISTEALATAAENARHNQLPNIEFLAGDWIDPVHDRKFDMIVSNPPYVASNDPALKHLRHEPVTALVAGKDGLDAIRHIASRAGDVLITGGRLLLEHGAEQADAVAEILYASQWSDVATAKDLAAKPRVTTAVSL